MKRFSIELTSFLDTSFCLTYIKRCDLQNYMVQVGMDTKGFHSFSHLQLNYGSLWRYADMINTFDIWNLENDFKKLLKVNDRFDFDFPAPRADAFYYAWRNHIGEPYIRVIC